MIRLDLTDDEAQAVHQALYLRLRELAMIEDHNPDPAKRREAARAAAPLIAAADKLLALCAWKR